MGRTNPTYRDALRALEERWATYRRALRGRDQPRFDRLFTYARDHADASGLLNHETPLLPALFSIDVEQERRLDEQAERVDEQAERVDAQASRLDDHEERIAALEAELAALRERVDD
jgi:predicted RNase H-like nuclease (RuvC/YqgF family)